LKRLREATKRDGNARVSVRVILFDRKIMGIRGLSKLIKTREVPLSRETLLNSRDPTDQDAAAARPTAGTGAGSGRSGGSAELTMLVDTNSVLEELAGFEDWHLGGNYAAIGSKARGFHDRINSALLGSTRFIHVFDACVPPSKFPEWLRRRQTDAAFVAKYMRAVQAGERPLSAWRPKIKPEGSQWVVAEALRDVGCEVGRGCILPRPEADPSR
jgi:hypothetical protein